MKTMKAMQVSTTTNLGLKKLRKGNERDQEGKPKYYCSNCDCRRYTPCGCMKKK